MPEVVNLIFFFLPVIVSTSQSSSFGKIVFLVSSSTYQGFVFGNLFVIFLNWFPIADLHPSLEVRTLAGATIKIYLHYFTGSDTSLEDLLEPKRDLSMNKWNCHTCILPVAGLVSKTGIIRHLLRPTVSLKAHCQWETAVYPPQKEQEIIPKSLWWFRNL